MNDHEPDIFALSESKLIPSITDKEICSKYTLYRRDRHSTAGPGRGGGVLIGISDACNIKVIHTYHDRDGEILSLDLDANGYRFSFTTYYHPPSVRHINDIINWFNESIACNHIIVGDFNLPDIDWDTKKLKNRSNLAIHESFLEFLSTSGLEQIINFPTHIRGNILDLILTNLDTTSPNAEPSCSDHHVITFEMNLPFTNNHTSSNISSNSNPYWLFKKSNLPEIIVDCSNLESTVNAAISNNYSIETVWSIFRSGILNTAQYLILLNTAPYCTRKHKVNSWLTRETKTEIARRRRWFKTSRTYKTEENLKKLSEQSKLCNKLVNRDYNSFINKYICDTLADGQSKPLFKFIDSKRGNTNTIKQLDNCDNSSFSIAECFADAFSSVFTVDDGSKPNLPVYMPTQHNLITVYDKGVLKQLNNLNIRKGTGPDGLSAGLLKFLA